MYRCQINQHCGEKNEAERIGRSATKRIWLQQWCFWCWLQTQRQTPANCGNDMMPNDSHRAKPNHIAARDGRISGSRCLRGQMRILITLVRNRTVCDVRFTDHSNLRRHVRVQHTVMRRLWCKASHRGHLVKHVCTNSRWVVKVWPSATRPQYEWG